MSDQRLCDAAPDMLDALHETRRYLYGKLCADESSEFANTPTARLYRLVDAVIGKARGK